MIIEPPGEPTASTGVPWRVTIVGAIELRGRLPPAAEFGCAGSLKLKSVNSLLSRNPQPGTTMPLPPVDSIVNVYDDDLAVVVGDGQMGRRRALWSTATPVAVPRSPGGTAAFTAGR